MALSYTIQSFLSLHHLHLHLPFPAASVLVPAVVMSAALPHQDYQNQRLDRQVLQVCQASIIAHVILEGHPQQLSPYGRPHRLAHQQKVRSAVHECDQHVPQYLVGVEAAAIGLGVEAGRY